MEMVHWRFSLALQRFLFSYLFIYLFFCGFGRGCHRRTRQLQVLQPDFNELQLIIAQEIDKLVTRYQGVYHISGHWKIEHQGLLCLSSVGIFNHVMFI